MAVDIIDVDMLRSIPSLANAEVDTLMTLIRAASHSIERRTKHIVKRRSFTELIDGPGDTILLSPRIPIYSLNQITLGVNTSTPEQIGGDQYDFHSRTGEIKLKPTSTKTATFPEGFQNIEMIFDAGFDPIPEDLQMACKLLAQHINTQDSKGVGLKTEKIGSYSYTVVDHLGASSIDKFPPVVEQLLQASGLLDIPL